MTELHNHRELQEALWQATDEAAAQLLEHLADEREHFRRLTMAQVEAEDAKLQPEVICPPAPRLAETPVPSTEEKTLAEMIETEFSGMPKGEIARIGGVSRVWLNLLLKGHLVNRGKLSAFLDNHRIWNQSAFLDALEHQAQAEGKTSLRKYDIYLSSSNE